MKLLIITQKVDKNDPVLGFFHRWIEEFAKHFERVTVICLGKGEYSLPQNVKVLSLGKEEGKSHAEYLSRFYRYIWTERENYDSVFVHMNPEYVLFGGIIWKILKKKISLWYVHRQVNLKLRLAERITDLVFTSTKQSFRLPSYKVLYLGHGIDLERFAFAVHTVKEPISIAHVGRITRIKNIGVILAAAALLRDQGVTLDKITLVGEPVTADDGIYLDELKKEIIKLGLLDQVNWLGAVQNSEMPMIYRNHTFSANAAPDGGMDKAVLESWASGCPAFVSNSSFKQIFGSEESLYFFSNGSDLCEKITSFLKRDNLSEEIEKISKTIHSEYGIKVLVANISKILHD